VDGPGRAAASPSSLLAVPNVTAHPSPASVPITVLLYDGPLLCGYNVAIIGLSVVTVTGDNPLGTSPRLPLRENPPRGNPLGRLGSGPRLASRIGSELLRVSASFQIFALRMSLHSAGGLPPRIFSRGRVILGRGGVSPGRYILESVMYLWFSDSSHWK